MVLPARWRRWFENADMLGSIGDAPGPVSYFSRLPRTRVRQIRLEAFQNVPPNAATVLNCPSPRFRIGEGKRLMTSTMSVNRRTIQYPPFFVHSLRVRSRHAYRMRTDLGCAQGVM
jgi:hypothetical protein